MSRPTYARRAEREFATHHFGLPARATQSVTVYPPKHLAAMGWLESIEYVRESARSPLARVVADRIEFKPRPVLAYSRNGRLWIVGGSYRVTDNRVRMVRGRAGLTRTPFDAALRSPSANRAANDFADKHGGRRPRWSIVRDVYVPGSMNALGRVAAITYWTNKNEGAPFRYRHAFATPPLLCAAPRGTRLFVIGDGYTVTDRGIEDV